MRTALISVIALVAAGMSSGLERGAGPLRVTAVRLWGLDTATRIAIEADGAFEFHAERLHNPERVFFDILRARPSLAGKRVFSRTYEDKLVQRVRVAETVPGVTRIVLDLAVPAEFTASAISNPNRLVIELRPSGAEPPAPASPVKPAAVESPARAPAAKTTAIAIPELKPPAIRPETAPAPSQPAVAAPAARAPAAKTTASAIPELKPPAIRPETAPAPSQPAVAAPAAPVRTGTTAAHTSDGRSSLVRALGLKLKTVVIDPGHGGHDQGTTGPRGLVEKDLVLDVALRLGKLVQEGLGSEVIYTRSDDTFVPLEGRTELANEKKADLFVSLHANSSRYPRIGGTETFYLNFTSSRDALDVAARENAASQKSISELQDVLQKITLQNKIEESRELAGRLQTTMFAFSSRNLPGIKNRGVKMAPFVVLIGAQMPSVLVEIGFLTNAREETLLKRSEHRQRVAEALFQGISRYAQGLSHFQVAEAKDTPPISAGGQSAALPGSGR